MHAPLYRALAMLVNAYQRCLETGNPHSLDHKLRIGELVSDHLPSGSGLDSGCTLDLDKSTPDKLVIATSFQHMNDAGTYDGWTEHTITVTTSLAFEISIRISGRDRNQIKDYLGDLFLDAMRTAVDV